MGLATESESSVQSEYLGEDSTGENPGRMSSCKQYEMTYPFYEWVCSVGRDALRMVDGLEQILWFLGITHDP